MSIANVIRPVEPFLGDLAESVYRSSASLSPSTLVHGLHDFSTLDPYAVKLAYESPGRKVTDEMVKGTLAHLMLFEPDEIDNRVSIWSGGDRRGKEWKDFEAANWGRLIVRECDYAEVSRGMEQARDTLDDVFAGCLFEQSMQWNEDDIAMRGRPDAYRSETVAGERRVALLDFKTTNDISDRATERVVIDLHYREKMSLYRRGHSLLTEHPKEDYRVFLVFARMTPPFGVNVKQLDSICLDFFEQRMLALIEEVRQGIRKGFKPLVTASAMGLMPWEEPRGDE